MYINVEMYICINGCSPDQSFLPMSPQKTCADFVRRKEGGRRVGKRQGTLGS